MASKYSNNFLVGIVWIIPAFLSLWVFEEYLFRNAYLSLLLITSSILTGTAIGILLVHRNLKTLETKGESKETPLRILTLLGLMFLSIGILITLIHSAPKWIFTGETVAPFLLGGNWFISSVFMSAYFKLKNWQNKNLKTVMVETKGLASRTYLEPQTPPSTNQSNLKEILPPGNK
jgi:hypothetical protein